MRRHLARFLVILLLAVVGSGTWVSAICECTHGPDVECECPHHEGADPDDASLPPCHRAAALKARAKAQDARASAGQSEGSARFKNQCGSRAPAFVQLGVTVMPAWEAGPPEPVALPIPRWRFNVSAPRSPEEKIEPPPPRLG